MIDSGIVNTLNGNDKRVGLNRMNGKGQQLPSRATSAPSLEISCSRQFTAWLAEQNLSLAFTTYQAGKVFFIGLQPDGQLSVFERTFNRCMGLWAEGSTLIMSSLYQLWRFENALEPGQTHNGYDCLYVPQVGYITGDLDVHDVALATPHQSEKSPLAFPNQRGSGKQVVFVNTLFSCLATVSEQHSFVPLWQPPFISRIAAED